MMLASKMDDILNANLAIDHIWALPTLRGSDALRDALDNDGSVPEELLPFVEGWDEDAIEALMDGDGDTWEHFTQRMIAAGWCGFLVEVSTPVMTEWRGLKSWSWGHTWGKVIIADTLEEAIDRAIVWADEQSEIVETAA